MNKSWLLCVLLGTLAWGQAAPATPPQAAPPAQAAPAPAGPMSHPQMLPGPGKIAPPPDNSAQVPATAAVITIDGVCPAKPRPAAASKATVKPASDTKTTAPKAPADCKTIITKADFETLAKGLSPNMTPQLKRQLANILPRLYAMSAEGKKNGLDKGPEYAAAVKFYQMQILSQLLQRKIQDNAAKKADDKVKGYYDQNPEAYEQYSLQRLFIPKAKQAEPIADEDKDKDEKLTDEQKKAKQDAEKAKTEASEQEMTKLADTLRARAAAGEDFIKLQKEAFDAAGMKIESPTVSLPKVRRTGLPPTHSAVFDLKAGEVSQVITDNGGHYIYKVESKEVLPLDQVKDEIHNKLQNEDAKDAMEKITNSFKATNNEEYFGPPAPGGMNGPPPRRMPNPRMPGSPVQPQGAPPSGPGSAAPAQTPPPAAQPN
jgi:hypothetical protein